MKFNEYVCYFPGEHVLDPQNQMKKARLVRLAQVRIVPIERPNAPIQEPLVFSNAYENLPSADSRQIRTVAGIPYSPKSVR